MPYVSVLIEKQCKPKEKLGGSEDSVVVVDPSIASGRDKEPNDS